MLHFPDSEKYNHMIRFQFFSGAESDLVVVKFSRKHAFRRKWRVQLAKYRQMEIYLSEENRSRLSTILHEKTVSVEDCMMYKLETEEIEIRVPESCLTYQDDVQNLIIL